MSVHDGYEAVIGLEVHAQLLAETKAFCGCRIAFGGEPNANVCPVCLGLPGALPVLNMRVVEAVVKMGLAVGSTIETSSSFARKHYFYPDLPKGYQITQLDRPICRGGHVEIEPPGEARKRIGISRIHLEEDAGKSIHDAGDCTLLDLNRCGIPLMEIVGEPDVNSAHEAYLFLHKIRQIVTYLGICDGNMEEGSLRCDANISVRRAGAKLGTKTEVKNMNSFRNVERAIDYEVTRQVGILRNEGTVRQETLLWDARQNAAIAMRGKEESDDYRYFPEPDLLPVRIHDEWVRRIGETLPEHPTARRDRFVRDYGLPTYDADVLTSEKEYADYFESCVHALPGAVSGGPKLVSNWMMTELLRAVKREKISAGAGAVSPGNLAELIGRVSDGSITGKMAKEILDEMLATGDRPSRIIERKGLTQISDRDILVSIVEDVLRRHDAQVAQYKGGKETVFGFLVGAVMNMTNGRANPAMVNEILKKKLSGG